MNLVTRLARHCGLIGEIGAQQVPWPRCILRLDQVANRSIEVHAVAAKAIVHQTPLGVVHRIGKDLTVGSAVRTCVPCGVLALVASLAASCHLRHIRVAQTSTPFRPME